MGRGYDFEEYSDEPRGDEPMYGREPSWRENTSAPPSFRNWRASLEQQQEPDMTAKPVGEMSFDEAVPSNSKYLQKNDVGEDGRVLTIKGLRYEVLKSDDGEEDKLVCHWMEPDVKPMVVNRTNAQLMGAATGSAKISDAKGKKVLVYSDPMIQFGGRVTGGLRIKKAPAETGPMGKGKPDFDDDIPF